VKTVKLKTGDVIKLKPEHAKELNKRNDEIQALMCSIEMLSQSVRNRRMDFWDFIYEVHPEADKFHMSYDNGTVLIKTKKED